MSYRESREMHKAVCAECGQKCQVPFKPDQYIAETVGLKDEIREAVDIKLTS